MLRDHPADVPIFGTSITMLLAAALDTDDQEATEDTPSSPPANPRPAPAPQSAEPLQPPSPDADIDERIIWIRQAKEAAIEEQDFEQAALLRNREKDLLAEARQGLSPAP